MTMFYIIIYNILFTLLLPFIGLKFLFNKKYHAYWQERFALYAKKPPQGAIWVHAVSLGEVNAALPLINLLRENHTVIVTTTTNTGRARLQQIFSDQIWYGFLPLDHIIFCRKFLNLTKPQLAIIMETEIWPNYYYYLAQRKIPFLIANGRISPQAFSQYQKIKFFLKYFLAKVSFIGCQSEIDLQHYLALGADESCTKMLGNIKYNLTVPKDLTIKTDKLKQIIGTDKFIFLLASTHADEEEQFLKIYLELKNIYPNLLLIIAPRHPERFDVVKKLILDHNLKIVTRTEDRTVQMNDDVFLANTIGELLYFYAICDLAFVGGSLVNIGGHNILEAALFAKPIIVGPYMQNNTAIVQDFSQHNAIIVIHKITDLLPRMQEFKANPELLIQFGKRAEQQITKAQKTLQYYQQQVEILIKSSL